MIHVVVWFGTITKVAHDMIHICFEMLEIVTLLSESVSKT